ncbi:MAG: hypothetical protein R2856_09320 [Caldilineaceae bacterium]
MWTTPARVGFWRQRNPGSCITPGSSADEQPQPLEDHGALLGGGVGLTQWMTQRPLHKDGAAMLPPLR